MFWISLIWSTVVCFQAGSIVSHPVWTVLTWYNLFPRVSCAFSLPVERDERGQSGEQLPISILMEKEVCCLLHTALHNHISRCSNNSHLFFVNNFLHFIVHLKGLNNLLYNETSVILPISNTKGLKWLCTCHVWSFIRESEGTTTRYPSSPCIPFASPGGNSTGTPPTGACWWLP